jgi:hypothetical protein
LVKAYWNSYLNAFDPDSVLEQSKWDIAAMKKDKAVVPTDLHGRQRLEGRP